MLRKRQAPKIVRLAELETKLFGDGEFRKVEVASKYSSNAVPGRLGQIGPAGHRMTQAAANRMAVLPVRG
jgi:hypothetical protein